MSVDLAEGGVGAIGQKQLDQFVDLVTTQMHGVAGTKIGDFEPIGDSGGINGGPLGPP